MVLKNYYPKHSIGELGWAKKNKKLGLNRDFKCTSVDWGILVKQTGLELHLFTTPSIGVGS